MGAICPNCEKEDFVITEQVDLSKIGLIQRSFPKTCYCRSCGFEGEFLEKKEQ